MSEGVRERKNDPILAGINILIISTILGLLIVNFRMFKNGFDEAIIQIDELLEHM